MQVEALLAPVAHDDPAGRDLSYDPGRQAIEAVFDAPSEESDWPRVVAMIEAQARVTRDMWLGVYLTRAGAYAGDLVTVEAGAALLAGLFEEFWETAHPTLDEYGIEGRKGACESLVRIGEFLAPLRRVALLNHARLGSFSGGDFERFANGGPTEEGYGQFRAALADTPVDHLDQTLARLRRVRDALTRADAVLSDKAQAEGHTGTNFARTYEVLDALIGAVATYAAPAEVAEEPVATNDEKAETVVVEHPASQGGVGRIRSREDVARAIDSIAEYYARAEPSSPVPVALERIKGWIAMDFVAILNDIAPGSLSEATTVLKARADSGKTSSDLM